MFGGNPAVLNSNSPEVVEFLQAWHENGRAAFERLYPSLNYDTDSPKTAKTGRKWICLDCGTGGVFVCDRLTHRVFHIKSKYGVPNLRKPCGTIESLTNRYRENTELRQMVGQA